MKPTASPSLWRPLQVTVFRNLLIADVISDAGAFMQNVGAAWLMVSLGAGPIYVAPTQTAASLPYFLLALPAGSAGDIGDRRKLILFTESWMMGVALILAILTIAGVMSPWILLVLRFALSAGDAFEAPAWRAILPELVPKEDLAAASALNGIEFSLARAVGPALAGMIISAAGVATAFIANFVSFFGVILVVAKWKRRWRPILVTLSCGVRLHDRTKDGLFSRECAVADVLRLRTGFPAMLSEREANAHFTHYGWERAMINALPSSCCSKGLLGPAVGILPALVSRPLGSFGVQRVDDGCGVLVDHCEERPCWGLRLAPAGFPILHVVEAETKRDGELGLCETEAFADGLHIDLSGEGGLVAFGISLEVGLDLAKSVHEFVECGGQGLSLPVCVKNSVCAFLKFVSLCLGKIGFLVLRKDRDEEDGKPLIDVNNASAPLFPISSRATRTFLKPPVPPMTSADSGSAATRLTMSARSSSLKSLFAMAR